MPETTMPETAGASEGGPLFPLGRTVATPGALDALDLAGVAPHALLDRHARGDWGELGEDDRRANGQALSIGERLLSAYALPDGVRVWIITEADRSATTLLLPSDYTDRRELHRSFRYGNADARRHSFFFVHFHSVCPVVAAHQGVRPCPPAATITRKSGAALQSSRQIPLFARSLTT